MEVSNLKALLATCPEELKIPLGVEGYMCAPVYWHSPDTGKSSGPFWVVIISENVILEFSLSGHLTHTGCGWSKESTPNAGTWSKAWSRDPKIYIEQLERVQKVLLDRIKGAL